MQPPGAEEAGDDEDTSVTEDDSGVDDELTAAVELAREPAAELTGDTLDV